MVLKSGFALKEKKKFVSPTYFFLISIYTCWNNVILRGNWRSGEGYLPSDSESQIEKEESFLSYC